MFRSILIILGISLLVIQQFGVFFSDSFQFSLFIIGIVLLGIPHGAADLLVAIQNEQKQSSSFSRLKFFRVYLGKMLVFGIFLYFFPFIGMSLFLIFAAYHFGETDLYFFKTNKFWGKLLVVSYGFAILAVILLHNVEELRQIVSIAGLNENNLVFFENLIKYKVAIISISLVTFFCSVFLYFTITKERDTVDDHFLWQFGILIVILFNLPLLLGFTFYFVIWHSTLSIRNIFSYLVANKKVTYFIIFKQIAFYSFLAISGIAIFIFGSYFVFSFQSVIMYILFGLAVLTAPHMNIMHEMYGILRKKN